MFSVGVAVGIPKTDMIWYLGLFLCAECHSRWVWRYWEIGWEIEKCIGEAWVGWGWVTQRMVGSTLGCGYRRRRRYVQKSGHRKGKGNKTASKGSGQNTNT